MPQEPDVLIQCSKVFCCWAVVGCWFKSEFLVCDAEALSSNSYLDDAPHRSQRRKMIFQRRL